MRLLTCFMMLLLGATLPALADEEQVIHLTLTNHIFTPSEITVPAGKGFIIQLTNNDADAEEFDSDALSVEKVVAGNSEGTIHVHALDAGKYEFSGEYHENTAKGVVIAQ